MWVLLRPAAWLCAGMQGRVHITQVADGACTTNPLLRFAAGNAVEVRCWTPHLAVHDVRADVLNGIKKALSTRQMLSDAPQPSIIHFL